MNWPVSRYPVIQRSVLSLQARSIRSNISISRKSPYVSTRYNLTLLTQRGMTLAPRVELFTQLSCNALHHHYNHSSYQKPLITPAFPPNSPSSHHNPLTPFYFFLDPLGPHLHPSTLTFSPLPLPLHPSNSNHTTTILRTQDPSPIQQCTSDPAVQARAAHLQTIMTITMGLLSALTTSWWGHFSERHGRTAVLAISTFGLLITYAHLLNTNHSSFTHYSLSQ